MPRKPIDAHTGRLVIRMYHMESGPGLEYIRRLNLPRRRSCTPVDRLSVAEI